MTIVYLVCTVPAQFVLGLFVALVINRIVGRILGVLRTVLMIPHYYDPGGGGALSGG